MAPRCSLSIAQKSSIIEHNKAKLSVGVTLSQSELAEWAYRSLRLQRRPSQSMISRLLAAGASSPNLDGPRHIVRRSHGKEPQLEASLAAWIRQQHHLRNPINGDLIRAAAGRFIEAMNKLLSPEQQIKLKLSNGWLTRFQKRWGFRCYRSHGESGDADVMAVARELPSLRRTLRGYSLKDIWNGDEFGHFFQHAPDYTISFTRPEGRKKSKARLTYLSCANADGSERFPLMIIGKARKPRCFKSKAGQELGFDYWSNKSAWMNFELFKRWLLRFNSYIAKKPGRKALLLLDNCSAHGNSESLPILSNVAVLFLPPNTTSKIQPLDAGIIASLKVRYRKEQMSRAVDALDAGDRDIFKVDQLRSMTIMKRIWGELSNSTFINCWRHTGLLEGYGEAPVADCMQDLQLQVRDLQASVGLVAPPGRSINVQSLLNLEGKTTVLSPLILVGS